MRVYVKKLMSMLGAGGTLTIYSFNPCLWVWLGGLVVGTGLPLEFTLYSFPQDWPHSSWSTLPFP